MSTGMIEGGWNYVIAAYGITWTVLLIYGANLFFRRGPGERA